MVCAKRYVPTIFRVSGCVSTPDARAAGMGISRERPPPRVSALRELGHESDSGAPLPRRARVKPLLLLGRPRKSKSSHAPGNGGDGVTFKEGLTHARTRFRTRVKALS